MKKMRKLVPAFAMLMVAAIMMSTASFAWFSMNTTASATGMQVTAKSEGGLAIAVYTGGAGGTATEPAVTAYQSTASIGTTGWRNSDSALSPTSYSDSGSVWYTTTAKAVDDGAAKDLTAEEIAAGKTKYTAIDGTTGAGYYYQTKWSIKTLAEGQQSDINVTGVNVTVPANDGLQVLANSLRVMIVTEKDTFYFAPLYATAPAGEATLKCVASTDDSTTYANLACGATPAVTILDDVSTTAKDVNVYIYFEGEDPNCKSSNAINLEGISVGLTFTAVNTGAVVSGG